MSVLTFGDVARSWHKTTNLNGQVRFFYER
jgi:hypothetical protein